MATATIPTHDEDIVLLDVSWETYEAILSDIGDRGNTRIAYDGGTLELMSPLNDHEAHKTLLELLLNAVMAEWKINLFCTGSGTLKANPVGAEPDTSYYITRARDIDGLARIDLSTNPPPDLVVEVDLSRRRMDKSALYARLGVPEFWRIDRHGVRAFRLDESPPREIPVSIAIPGLPIDVLGRFLKRRLESNRLSLLTEWQEWLREERARQREDS